MIDINTFLKRAYSYRIRRSFASKYGPSSDAVILGSYPKSGNKFMRFVWLNLLIDLEEMDWDPSFKLLDDVLPFDFFLSDYKKKWNYTKIPVLLKTHRRYSSRFDHLRKIHVFRNPLDTLISNYKYFSSRTSGPTDVGMGFHERLVLNSPDIRLTCEFSDYVRSNAHASILHFLSWMETDAVCLSYEDMMSTVDGDVIFNVLERLNLGVTRDQVHQAVNRSLAKNVRDSARSSRMAELQNMHFIRSGKVGQHEDIFDEDLLEFVCDLLRKYKLDDIKGFKPEYREVVMRSWPTTLLGISH